MAYALRYKLDVVWLPDGAGPMTVPDAQVISFFNNPPPPGGLVLVPGGDAPSAANFNTAIGTTSPLAGSMAADLEAQILANLTRIQGFATGSG